jgi:hypothetical protein
MPDHLKFFLRNSDCVKKKKKYIVPFLAFEKRVVTQVVGKTIFETRLAKKNNKKNYCKK